MGKCVRASGRIGFWLYQWLAGSGAWDASGIQDSDSGLAGADKRMLVELMLQHSGEIQLILVG